MKILFVQMYCLLKLQPVIRVLKIQQSLFGFLWFSLSMHHSSALHQTTIQISTSQLDSSHIVWHCKIGTQSYAETKVRQKWWQYCCIQREIPYRINVLYVTREEKFKLCFIWNLHRLTDSMGQPMNPLLFSFLNVPPYKSSSTGSLFVASVDMLHTLTVRLKTVLYSDEPNFFNCAWILSEALLSGYRVCSHKLSLSCITLTLRFP